MKVRMSFRNLIAKRHAFSKCKNTQVGTSLGGGMRVVGTPPPSGGPGMKVEGLEGGAELHPAAGLPLVGRVAAGRMPRRPTGGVGRGSRPGGCPMALRVPQDGRTDTSAPWAPYPQPTRGQGPARVYAIPWGNLPPGKGRATMELIGGGDRAAGVGREPSHAAPVGPAIRRPRVPRKQPPCRRPEDGGRRREQGGGGGWRGGGARSTRMLGGGTTNSNPSSFFGTPNTG